MKFRVCNDRGLISPQLNSAKEVVRAIMREAIVMCDDDVILAYYNVDDSILLGKNFLSVHLKDGILEVYNEKTKAMCFYDIYSKTHVYNLFCIIKTEVEAVIKEYEIKQFEQAEVLKEIADYRVNIGGNIFKFTGETAADIVYKVIKGIFSSVSKDDGIIVITNAITGVKYDISYEKGYTHASITVKGRTRYFTYYIPQELSALMGFIKKEVIL